eukprot:Sspe_Gene.40662::Locus_19650_Transcript_1_1_Confidence_1.000_Length_1084::g.40662::m.40662
MFHSMGMIPARVSPAMETLAPENDELFTAINSCLDALKQKPEETERAGTPPPPLLEEESPLTWQPEGSFAQQKDASLFINPFASDFGAGLKSSSTVQSPMSSASDVPRSPVAFRKPHPVLIPQIREAQLINPFVADLSPQSQTSSNSSGLRTPTNGKRSALSQADQERAERTIHLMGIDASKSIPEILDLVSVHGARPVKMYRLCGDTSKKRTTRFAFIEFETSEDAHNSVNDLHLLSFGVNILQCHMAKNPIYQGYNAEGESISINDSARKGKGPRNNRMMKQGQQMRNETYVFDDVFVRDVNRL